MKHHSMSIKEMDLERYIEDSVDINILVKTSYQKETSVGTYRCLLLYKQHKKYIENTIANVVSPNHVMVLGLIEAVKHIKLHNVKVCIISGIYVGFKAAAKNKGMYANEVNEIVDIVEKQGNTISSIAITDGMDEIKRIMRKYEGEMHFNKNVLQEIIEEFYM